ncbi:hypothetical protein EVAR_17992_1 [Eumeta japonica]|uniref:Uncharacterized protein n=1 Tax=Eumeta variegata TaxID=151549 RepID=A0A4C1Y9B4_EUMVA|nr:hypothetical protein EVAR_17992_1 [Eumeta japonica]
MFRPRLRLLVCLSIRGLAHKSVLESCNLAWICIFIIPTQWCVVSLDIAASTWMMIYSRAAYEKDDINRSHAASPVRTELAAT